MKNLNDISLTDIAPSSILGDKNIDALIKGIDPQLKLVTDNITQEFILSRIDELDSGVLDLLAWQFHVDFYDLAQELPDKREQIKNSILWHMKKGTVWAILKALDMIGITPKFINWYESGGDPYTFKIDAEIRHDYFKYGDKDEIGKNILRAIYEAKATRSFMSDIYAYFKEYTSLNITAGMAQGLGGYEIINLSPPQTEHDNILYAGMIHEENKEFSMEVDLNTMNELLAQFENRIFARMDQDKREIKLYIDNKYSELDAKLDEILELLRWH